MLTARFIEEFPRKWLLKRMIYINVRIKNKKRKTRYAMINLLNHLERDVISKKLFNLYNFDILYILDISNSFFPIAMNLYLHTIIYHT